MEALNKICCGCYNKAKVDSEESVLMIEDFMYSTRLVEKEPEQTEEIPKPPEQRKNLAVRRHAKLSKKPLKKIDITGAVAAVPPPPVEQVVGSVPSVGERHDGLNLGGGVYLIYSLEDNGSLFLQYAHRRPDSMDGVLGYIRPGREIRSFHYEDNAGRHVLSRNVCEYMRSGFQHDRKKYYGVWHEFLLLLNAYGGSLWLLPAFALSPPPPVRLVLFTGSGSKNNSLTGHGSAEAALSNGVGGHSPKNDASGSSDPSDGSSNSPSSLSAGVLTELGTCRELVFRESELVGILPFSLDYRSKLINGVNRVDFIKLCESYGFVFESVSAPARGGSPL